MKPFEHNSPELNKWIQDGINLGLVKYQILQNIRPAIKASVKRELKKIDINSLVDIKAIRREIEFEVKKKILKSIK